jgi:hypothetical protein
VFGWIATKPILPSEVPGAIAALGGVAHASTAALKSLSLKTRIETMTNKSNFTPDEWKLILSSPMLAGMAVTLADPSGLWA